MSEVIDLKTTIRNYCKERCGCEPEECGLTYEVDGTECCSVVAFLKEQPTIEAVEVVRCKDCRWWDKKENSNYGYCHAIKHCHYSKNWEILIYRTYPEDFFCADGERRDNAAD